MTLRLCLCPGALISSPSAAGKRAGYVSADALVPLMSLDDNRIACDGVGSGLVVRFVSFRFWLGLTKSRTAALETLRSLAGLASRT